jgi:hypothetical protein
MPLTPHIEHHFTSSETVRDVVIGGMARVCFLGYIR